MKIVDYNTYISKLYSNLQKIYQPLMKMIFFLLEDLQSFENCISNQRLGNTQEWD